MNWPQTTKIIIFRGPVKITATFYVIYNEKNVVSCEFIAVVTNIVQPQSLSKLSRYLPILNSSVSYYFDSHRDK